MEDLFGPVRAIAHRLGLEPQLFLRPLGESDRPDPAGVAGSLAPLRDLVRRLSLRQTFQKSGGRTLQRLAGLLELHAAAIFAIAGDHPGLVASVGDMNGALEEPLEALAAWVGNSGEPVLLTDPRRVGLASSSVRERASREVLALPVAPGTREGYVLIVVGATTSLASDERRLAVVAAAAAELALAAERDHAEEVLEAQLDDARQTQRQLEAYAQDVRKMFLAERKRARELAAALAELHRTYLATVHSLAVAVEAKDALTAGHIARVTNYGLEILKLVLPEEAENPEYEYGFLLHDIGKLSVPDNILGKEGPLTDEEWKIMRLHPESGRRILEGIPFLETAKEMVYAHHERWDGKGYPRGLEGEEIQVPARLFPVVDSYDAMTSDRPYRSAMPIDAALTELQRHSGSQFWPDAVEAFLSVPIERLEAIRTGPQEWVPHHVV
jgi:ribonuclease P protein subunit RPR2